MMNSKRSRFLGFVSLLLALCAPAAGCKTKEGPTLPPAEGEGAPPAPTLPKLADLAPKNASELRSTARASTGSLRPRSEVALGPKETGVLSMIAVEEGQRVKKGQLMFRQEAAQAQLGVEQANAAVRAAQVQLDAAKTDFERVKSLRERGSIAADVFDGAQTRVRAAQTAVEQATVAVSQSARRTTDLSVASPIDGIVIEKRMNVGEVATLMPPSVVLVIADIDQLELRARLPESSLKTLREGSEVTAHFPAVDVSRRVIIKRIAPIVDPRTRTIEIVADLDNRGHALRAGMLAEVAYDPAEQKEVGAPTSAPSSATAQSKTKGK